MARAPMTLKGLHHLQKILGRSTCAFLTWRISAALPPHHRCSDHPAGVLAVVWATCPALRELELSAAYLDQPKTSLAHLTCLRLDNCRKTGEGTAPLRSLAAAAPRLEVLSSCQERSNGNSVAEAAAGHPCLRELIVDLKNVDPRTAPPEGWLCTAQQLTALERLALKLPVDLVPGVAPGAGPQVQPGGGFTAGLLDAIGRLVHCHRLAHLELTGNTKWRSDAKPVHEVLAAVGAAAGDRLRSLSLNGTALPLKPADVASVLGVLPVSFPRLEVLALHVLTLLDASPLAPVDVPRVVLAPLAYKAGTPLPSVARGQAEADG